MLHDVTWLFLFCQLIVKIYTFHGHGRGISLSSRRPQFHGFHGLFSFHRQLSVYTEIVAILYSWNMDMALVYGYNISRFPKLRLVFFHRFTDPWGNPIQWWSMVCPTSSRPSQVGALTFEGRRVETALYHRECVLRRSAFVGSPAGYKKMWKELVAVAAWHLCWFGDDKDPKKESL